MTLRPHMGMGMVPSMGMEMVPMTTQDLKDRLQNLPQLHSHPSESGIVHYLQLVNKDVAAKHAPYERKRQLYLSAIGIYVFAQPILHLDLDDNVRNSFCRAIKSAYEVEREIQREPLLLLQVKFQPTGSAACKDCQQIVSGVMQAPKQLPQGMAGAVTERLKLAADRLGSDHIERYDHMDHYCFVGMYDVCGPLFRVDVENANYACLEEELRNKKGSFVIKIPHELAYD